ncbi:MAG TPA: hypothetical protein VFC00_21055 [Micromonosporaceae bacterium]|nr:hypothetical protein [Micromonosporaceae bacterium]
MNSNPAQRADVPSELSPAARLQLTELLRSELEAACVTALANGVTSARLAELIAERRAMLLSMQRDVTLVDDREHGVEPRLRIVQQD